MIEQMQSVFQELQRVIHVGRLLAAEPLSQHTTFAIGGPADIFVQPGSMGELAATMQVLHAHSDVPVTILGNGSNVLVLDRGIRGVVIKLGDFLSSLRQDGNRIFAGAGSLLSEVSGFAATQGLEGMEFAVGIPGSIGGAVFMNAGAYQGEMSCVVDAVTAVSPAGGVRRFSREELEFSYRHSIFQDNGHIVCEVELLLEAGESKTIEARMQELTQRRESKQPLELPSAGSTFKRPPGHFAGTLIEQSGLKGLRVGGAEVSQKHAGFIVNAGGATAQDVLALISEVQRQVQQQFGVSLQPEVRILGEA